MVKDVSGVSHGIHPVSSSLRQWLFIRTICNWSRIPCRSTDESQQSREISCQIYNASPNAPGLRSRPGFSRLPTTPRSIFRPMPFRKRSPDPRTQEAVASTLSSSLMSLPYTRHFSPTFRTASTIQMRGCYAKSPTLDEEHSTIRAGGVF